MKEEGVSTKPHLITSMITVIGVLENQGCLFQNEIVDSRYSLHKKKASEVNENSSIHNM